MNNLGAFAGRHTPRGLLLRVASRIASTARADLS
jgi:hypothetical protein